MILLMILGFFYFFEHKHPFIKSYGNHLYSENKSTFKINY